MGSVTYRRLIREVLTPYSEIDYANGEIQNEIVFDEPNDRYLIMSVGWSDEPRRNHGALLHLDLIDGKVWIQRDGTEDRIALDLENAGIPKQDIVLGFHQPEVRQLTDYAAA